MLASSSSPQSGTTHRHHRLLYTTDGRYVTPPPRSETDRQLWRLVIALYAYDSAEPLQRVVSTPSPSPSPPPMVSGPGRHGEEEEDDVGSRNSTGGADTAVRAENAPALPSADHARESTYRTDPSVAIAHLLRPLETTLIELQRQLQQKEKGRSDATKLATALTTRTAPWCSDTRAPTANRRGDRVMSSDNRELRKASGSVFDVALQHPFPPMRHAILECLLNYLEVFSFAFCAPLAVCAAVGDVEALRLLTLCGDDAFDPNSGSPLTIATRHNQLPMLQALLGASAPSVRAGEEKEHHSHPSSSSATATTGGDGRNQNSGANLLTRLKVNYGNPFAEAVRRGNVEAAAILASHEGVNVNRFASNSGSNPLLCACRAFISAAERVTALETALLQRGGTAVNGINSNHDHDHKNSNRGSSNIVLEVSHNATDHAERKRRPTEGGEESAVPSSARFTSSPPLAKAVASAVVGVSLPVRRKGLSPNSPTIASIPAASSKAAKAAGSSPFFPTATTASAAGGAPGRQSRYYFKQQLAEAVERLGECREMVCLLLSLPSLDVNMGYFISPLQLAAQGNCPELVELLLMHPSIRPHRTPKPATALAKSLFILQHQTLSQEALEQIIAPPIELAVRNNNTEVFAALVRHPRTVVTVALLEELERDPRDLTRVPFLEALAQYKAHEWEGWGWRWRRRCVYGAAFVGTALCALNLVLLCVYAQNANSLYWLLLFTYMFASAPTVCCSAFQRYRVPEALPAALACLDGSAVAGVAVTRRLATLPLAFPGPVRRPRASVGGSVDANHSGAAAQLTPSRRLPGGEVGTASLDQSPHSVPLSTVAAQRQCGVGTAFVRVVLSTSRFCRKCCCCFFWACCGGTGNGKVAEPNGGAAEEEEGVDTTTALGSSVVGHTAASLAALLLFAAPIVPLLELVVLWVFLVYLKRPGTGSSTGNDECGGGGNSPVIDSPEAFSRLVRRALSPTTHLCGRAERVVLVHEGSEDGGDVARNATGPPAAIVAAREGREGSGGRGRGQAADDDRASSQDEEELVEEAGRKVFLHDGDGIGDHFPFYQRKLQRLRHAAPAPASVCVVGGGVGSERLRRSPSPAARPEPLMPLRRHPAGACANESFANPRLAAAVDDADARQGNNNNNNNNKRGCFLHGAVPSPAATASLPSSLAQGKSRKKKHFSDAYLSGALSHGQGGSHLLRYEAELVEGPNLYVRSLAYLSLELVAPCRLAVAIASFFTHLITLFPETTAANDTVTTAVDDGGAVASNTGATVVSALGLLFSVLALSVYMLMCLALRRTSPQSVLSGRRHFYVENSVLGTVDECVL